MSSRSIRSAVLVLIAAFAVAPAAELFDGKTLSGWEGETARTWRVRDGVIVGGSLEGNPRNEFLASTRSYRNFVLTLEYRLVGSEGFVNSGVQVRSRRIAEPPNEMSGYQADIGAGYSGFLYDESRRKRVLAADKALVARLERPGEWNRYEIRCEGRRIRLALNGTTTVDYVEREPGIEQAGLIALQIHGGSKAEVAFRAIAIEELPDDLVPSPGEILARFGDASADLPAPWPGGRFAIADHETVVFAGQTNLAREQAAGGLEAQLAAAWAGHAPRFRSMAWEGDTVYEQWRDLNFGDWQGQLAAVGATTIVAQFGQVEALDGPGRLAEFTAAYHRLLDRFAVRTPRLVLLSPMPFERPLERAAPDLSARNADAAAYAEAVRAIARQRGALFIDLFTPLAARAGQPRLTDDGLHLTDDGLPVVARLIAAQLRAAEAIGSGGAPAAGADPNALRAAIAEKNRLFSDCWRPANWLFVYGDRVSQSFGKPVGDQPSLREAFERHRPPIAALDERIQALARGERPTPAPVAAAPPPAAADGPTPEAELAAFTVADGWRVELVASERDGLVDPTQLAWDERGRLYVACSPTYPHPRPGARPADFVLALEGRDAAGHAERVWRYAEDLTMVEGLEPGDGGLYVCDFDRLLHLRDADGDGRADQRRVVLSGFGVGDTHQLINSISHGPDGSLFTQGLHAMSRVETPWGLARLDRSGVWQLRPRTLRLEGFFNGAKAGHNCWGVAFDDFGQVFHKSGDRPAGYWSVPGLVPIADPYEYHPTGALFASEAKTTALEFIGTRALPDELQGCAVIGGFFAGTVELHRLGDDGAGFCSEQLPKLLRSSDSAFRPVDISIGPEGAIYVADWCNRVIGHYQASYADPRRDHGRGRIWRLSAIGRPPVAPPALAGMAPAQLLGQLASPERWTRAKARRLLGDAPDEAVLPAADAWLAALDPAAPATERLRFEALGVYQAHEAPRPALLAQLLAAGDPRIRAYATRAAGEWAARLPDALALLRERVGDPHPRVRLEAVVACSRLAAPEAVAVALRVLDLPRDRFIDYALAQTVRALAPRWRPALAAGAVGGEPLGAAGSAYLQRLLGARPAAAHPGKAIYDGLCLTCHQADARGLPGIYPPLAGSEWVGGPKPELIRILLHGLSGPIEVAGATYGVQNPLPMPPMGLDDQQLADVLSNVRDSFGNAAPAVGADEVRAVRAATAGRQGPWTAAELRSAK